MAPRAGGDLHALLMPSALVVVLAAVLVMGGPDLETAALLVAIGGVVLFVAGLPGQLVVGGVAGLAAVGVAVLARGAEFRQGRILAWLDPASDPANFGYQQRQGLIALGSGGLLGAGLGQGRGQWLYLPNAHTDFIFAVIGEELGLVGALLVLALFLVIAVAGVGTAVRAPDPFGRLVAAASPPGCCCRPGSTSGPSWGCCPSPA